MEKWRITLPFFPFNGFLSAQYWFNSNTLRVVRFSDQPAKILVAKLTLSEKGKVRSIDKRQFSAGDWLNAVCLATPGKLQRTVEPIMIRYRQCMKPQISRTKNELFRRRRSIQHGIC